MGEKCDVSETFHATARNAHGALLPHLKGESPTNISQSQR